MNPNVSLITKQHYQAYSQSQKKKLDDNLWMTSKLLYSTEIITHAVIINSIRLTPVYLNIPFELLYSLPETAGKQRETRQFKVKRG